MTGAVPAGEFIVGWVFLVQVLGAAVAAAVTLARRRLDHLDGSARSVAVALLTVATVIVEQLVPLRHLRKQYGSGRS